MCGFQSRRWRGQGQATATFHREPSSQHWRYTERAPQLEVDLAVLWGSCHSAECQSGFSLAPAAGQEERKDERGQWARALQCHLAGGAWPGHRIAASPLVQPLPASPAYTQRHTPAGVQRLAAWDSRWSNAASAAAAAAAAWRCVRRVRSPRVASSSCRFSLIRCCDCCSWRAWRSIW